METKEGEVGEQGHQGYLFEDGKDCLDAYLERFERFATTQKWPRADWASNLSGLVRGKALEVYLHLSVRDTSDVDTLKKALLSHYNLNAYGFKLKVRESILEEMESPHQFTVRFESYLMKW